MASKLKGRAAKKRMAELEDYFHSDEHKKHLAKKKKATADLRKKARPRRRHIDSNVDLFRKYGSTIGRAADRPDPQKRRKR